MKPKLLDLFCKAGGCSAGYAKAGFEVVGVDIEPQPNYPYQFIQADALEILKDKDFINQFAMITASPPCQKHSKARSLSLSRTQRR
jgi:DNA (cytosine-5)-methyltransferase 1